MKELETLAAIARDAELPLVAGERRSLGHAQAIGAIAHRLGRFVWKILHVRPWLLAVGHAGDGRSIPLARPPADLNLHS